MIDKKLRRIQFVTGIIVIVVGFFFIGCINSMNRTYNLDNELKGEGHTVSIPVNPVVDKKTEAKLGYNK